MRLQNLGCLKHLEGGDHWDLIGISKLGDVCDEGIMIPLDRLQKDYELSDSQSLGFLQV